MKGKYFDFNLKNFNLKNGFVKENLLVFIFSILGVLALAASVKFFYNPHNIVTGGVTGLGIALESLIGVPVWAWNIVFNIPLALWAAKIKGVKFIGKTVFATAALSFFLYILEFIPNPNADLFLSSVFGGALSGLGVGLVFRAKASTGGSDLLSILIGGSLKHVSVSRILFVIDSVVVMLGIYVFSFEIGLYSIMSVYISSKVVEYVLEGLNFSKAAFIISSKSDEIADKILHTMDRGVTGLFGTGMYTRADKTVLLTVVSMKEIVSVKEIVKETDGEAFILVADVREVFGEGFNAFG
jgi:uncharacterized membrane-anchored protein YitT (DUF2179 family)